MGKKVYSIRGGYGYENYGIVVERFYIVGSSTEK